MVLRELVGVEALRVGVLEHLEALLVEGAELVRVAEVDPVEEADARLARDHCFGSTSRRKTTPSSAADAAG